LFFGSVAGTAVFVAVGTLVNEDLVHLLAFAGIMGIGVLFGALTMSVKAGFAAALIEAWAGWWLGYFVSALVKAATTPDLGLLGWGGAVLFAIIGGFASGFIVGIVVGAAGAAGRRRSSWCGGSGPSSRSSRDFISSDCRWGGCSVR